MSETIPEAQFAVGDYFHLQFVWRIPNQDYLRAIFRAEVLMLDELSHKYVVNLAEFVAGRQEDSRGDMRSPEEVSRDYWAKVINLTGHKIAVAYESDDGRPLWLRFETLTGEHNFFSRLNELPEYFKKRLPEDFEF
ncbi:MAG: hypothetical protein ACK2T3_15645 [Candidatus Promineifilaceae bacterium]